MQKLFAATLIAIMAVWLVGCGGDGAGFTDTNDLNVSVSTYAQHHGSNNDFVAANIGFERPSFNEPYTMRVEVRATHKGSNLPVDVGTQVVLRVDDPVYGHISKLDEGTGTYHEFTQCNRTDPNDCRNLAVLTAPVSNNGTAVFFFTSSNVSCRTTEPCVSLIAEVEGSTGSARIRVGEPGSGMPVQILMGSETPAFIQRVNRFSTQKIQAWVYDEKDALVHDPEPGAANVRVRIAQGPGGGEYLRGYDADGNLVNGNQINVRTRNGVAEVTLIAGSATGPVLIEAIADRADNNVSNGVAEPITQLGQTSIVDAAPVEDTEAVPLAITTTALPGGKVGDSYVAILEITGGTQPYTVEREFGQLPPGLTLVQSGSAAGVIHGTPTTAGSYSMIIRVRDAKNAEVRRTFSIQIASSDESFTYPTLSTTQQNLNDTTALVGVFYAFVFQGSTQSNSPSWTIAPAGGALPPGLTLATNGNLTGTPSTAGSYTFVVRLTDTVSGLFTDRAFTLVVNANLSMTIFPTTLPNAQETMFYSQALVVSGGTAPYVWSIPDGNLPPDLALSTTNSTSELGIAIQGTPTNTSAGNHTFVVQVQDHTGLIHRRSYLLTVDPAP